jgi:hypothetical protein
MNTLETIALFGGLGLFATCVSMVILARLAERVARMEQRLSDIDRGHYADERGPCVCHVDRIRIQRQDAQWATEK